MARQLSESHRTILAEGSGITEAVITEMGAWTAWSEQDLREVGFSQAGLNTPALVLPFHTWTTPSEPIFHRVRADTPRLDSHGKPIKYEQPKGQASRIYCLQTARSLIEGLQGLPDRPVPYLDYIFVTEGEKKAAALVSQGLSALGICGVWNFKSVQALRGDWDAICLKGMKACIVFDSDAASNSHVRKAEERLADMLTSLGAEVFICRLPAGPNGKKTGVDDFFVRGGTVDDLETLIQRHCPEKPDAKTSATEGLIQLGSQRAKFWHDANREPFATIPLEKGGFDNLPVRCKRFRDWLGGEWYRSRKVAPPKDAVDRALDTLAAQAVYEGCEFETARRIGHTAGAVWLDLCGVERRVVRVTSEGWNVVSDDACPVRFLRPDNMRALPDPRSCGSLEGLRGLLSVDDDGLLVIQAFLLGAFAPPPGAMAILAVTGEQGSGKSFGCRVLRSVLDPSALGLRRMPRDERDLGAALNSGHILAFDNLSSVPSWLSDGLCSLATGGGIARRELYTNADELIVTGRRPVLLNGINDVVSAPDLAERCLFVEFVRPPDTKRLTEAELESLFERERGEILGALLDRVAHAIRHKDSIRPPSRLPRLADFAVWVFAGTPEDQRGHMWRVLTENSRSKSLATVEDDALASAVRTLAEGSGFLGTAKELLAELNRQEGIDGKKDRPEGWPTSATGLGKKLMRLKTALAAVGIQVAHSRKAKAREWTVASIKGEGASQASHASSEGTSEPEGTDSENDTCNDACDVSVQKASCAREVGLSLMAASDDTCDTNDALPTTPGHSVARRRIRL